MSRDIILLSVIFVFSAAIVWIFWTILKDIGLSNSEWFGYHAAIWNWPRNWNKTRKRK